MQLDVIPHGYAEQSSGSSRSAGPPFTRSLRSPIDRGWRPRPRSLRLGEDPWHSPSPAESGRDLLAPVDRCRVAGPTGVRPGKASAHPSRPRGTDGWSLTHEAPGSGPRGPPPRGRVISSVGIGIPRRAWTFRPPGPDGRSPGKGHSWYAAIGCGAISNGRLSCMP